MKKLIISTRSGHYDTGGIILMVPDDIVEAMKRLAAEPQNSGLVFTWPTTSTLRYVGSFDLSADKRLTAIKTLRNVSSFSLYDAKTFLESKTGETFPLTHGYDRGDHIISDFAAAGVTVEPVEEDEPVEEAVN
jgi:ribosomal protein L7/L12